MPNRAQFATYILCEARVGPPYLESAGFATLESQCYTVANLADRKAIDEFVEAMTIHGKAGLFRSTTISILSLMVLLCSVAGVGAEPSIESKRAQARVVKGQVDKLDQKLEIAVEEYNQASDELDETRERLVLTREKLQRERHRLIVRQGILNERAASIYLNGRIDFVEVVLSTQTFDDFLKRMDLLTRIGDHDAGLVASVKIAKRRLQRQKLILAKEEARQRKIVATREKKKSSIESTLAKRKEMLSGIQGEIAAMEAAERAAAEAARRAAIAAASSSSGGSSDDGGSGAGIPAHGDVVAYAESRLNCPYVWGGSGPNSFDCSGLTMWCYAQVGIGLPHSSSAQYGCGTHISRDNLKPGDLVFFGSPIHHVGLYVGGGQMIHAPHTGAVVRYDSVDGHGNYAGACRP